MWYGICICDVLNIRRFNDDTARTDTVGEFADKNRKA